MTPTAAPAFTFASPLGTRAFDVRDAAILRSSSSSVRQLAKNRRCVISAAAGRTSDEPIQVDGLTLNRRDLQKDSWNRPAAKYQLSASLEDIDLEDTGIDDNQVRASVVAQPVRGHYRVRGMVKGSINLTCDRCLDSYSAPSEGQFEVWLSGSGVKNVQGFTPEQEQALEAVEDFSGIEAEVDLAPHLRDALLLTAPTKALCDSGCKGITAKSGTPGMVAYGKEAARVAKEFKTQDKSSSGVFDKVSKDKMMGLREKLQDKSGGGVFDQVSKDKMLALREKLQEKQQ